jgi:Flp pilus assembly protein TadD
MTGELHAEVAALLAAGEPVRAAETLRRAQNTCDHDYGSWSGVGAAQRTCKSCGHVEKD